MGLSLRDVAPLQGSLWLRQGVTAFFRQPLAFCLLFLAYLVLASLLGAIPFVGAVLSVATVPLLSLAFMLATRDALEGRPVRLAHLFAVWREPPPRRRTMLLLCLGFGIAVTLVVELAVWWGGDELVEALKPLAKAERSAQDMMAVLSSPAIARLANTISAFAALLSVPYWHALALVHWGGQSAAQSLFSSTLALWRTKGAFLLYILGWVGLAMAASLVAGIGAALLAAVAGPLAFALGALIFIGLSASFYVSLWFMFADSFGTPEPEAVTPPA